jgi:hypothetical protein
MASPRLVELVLVAALALPLVAAAQTGGRSIYCCEDANGRPVCGDVLPAACYGRGYREISPQGTVRRHVAAPLTPQEIARRDAEAKRRKAEEERRLKQRRLDEALLETYKSLEDIDVRQDRALAQVQSGIESLRVREAELVVRRGEVEAEFDSYHGRDVPRELSNRLRNVDSELASHRTVIDAKTREMDAIRARFAADRRRYAELLASGVERR